MPSSTSSAQRLGDSAQFCDCSHFRQHAQRHDMLEATHDTIARDVEIVLEDMVFVLLSVRFYLRIVAFCMVFIALIALAAYLQTLPSIFQTSDFLHAATLRTNSQTAYLHNG